MRRRGVGIASWVSFVGMPRLVRSIARMRYVSFASIRFEDQLFSARGPDFQQRGLPQLVAEDSNSLDDRWSKVAGILGLRAVVAEEENAIGATGSGARLDLLEPRLPRHRREVSRVEQIQVSRRMQQHPVSAEF